MSTNRIILVTGGARSGKSSFALAATSRLPGQRAFIATAEALDEEMSERIEQHKRQRGQGWDTYEEPINIGDLIEDLGSKYDAIVLDCLTLWLSNIMAGAQNKEVSTQTIEAEISKLLESLNRFRISTGVSPGAGNCFLLLVSNEVGMGIVPENETARKFRDLAGLLNRKIAELADEVYMAIAGIPLKIKGAGEK
jgi:adenosylcobinamide kinase/adenosylcobinamide-phosphate guanylyltransferase